MRKIQIIILFYLFIVPRVTAQEFLNKYDMYSRICSGTNANYIVTSNNKYGVLNHLGDILISLEFDKIEEYSTKCANPSKDFIYKVTKQEQSGLIFPTGEYLLPLGNWSKINDLNNSIVAAQVTPYKYDRFSDSPNLDTTSIYRNGKLIYKTNEYDEFGIYNPKYFDNSMSDIILTAFNSNYSDYHYPIYSYFLVDRYNKMKLIFKNAIVNLWPNKIFLVKEFSEKKSISDINLSNGLNTDDANTYLANLKGDKITTNGIYSKIFSYETYPKFQAVSKEDGLTYIIDSAGNKLSIGYNNSSILVKQNYYFYKLYNSFSTLPLPTLQANKPIVSKDVYSNRNDNVAVTNQIYKYENLYMQIYRKDSTAILDFNGKFVTNWYKSLYEISRSNNKNISTYIAMKQNENVLLYSDNFKNEIKIPFFNSISFFSKGIYLIKVNDKFGLLNSNFEVVLTPNYDNILTFDENYVKLINNEKYGLFEPKNKLLIEPIYDNIDEYPVRVKFGGKWGKVKDSIFVPF